MPSPDWPRHVVAAGLLVRRKDEILLVKTPKRGWEFPGGQIEEGEALIEGVVREVKEEARIDARVDRLAGVYANIGASRVIFDFIGTYVDGVIGPSEETVDVAWLDPAEAINRVTHPGYSRRLRHLLQFDGRVLYQTYSSMPYTVFEERYV